MTREEAIDIFEHNWTRLENHDYTENELNEALDMATKALAQEPKTDILDKIRTEIDQEYTKFRNKSDMWNERACGLGTALEIIDKYKAESEKQKWKM